jgi:elongation factor P
MAEMLRVTKLRTGNLIIMDGELYRVHSVEHRTPGKGNACMQTKLRSVKNGNLVDKRFLSDEKVEKAELDNVEMEYLYHDGTGYVFMNTSTFEQLVLNEDVIGEGTGFLLPNTKVKIDFYNSEPVGIEFPLTVVLKIVETEPFVKRATASGQTKPAVLETGLRIIVPGYLSVDELIRINTETMEYVERADKYDNQ